jgi:hypothetical protein
VTALVLSGIDGVDQAHRDRDRQIIRDRKQTRLKPDAAA